MSKYFGKTWWGEQFLNSLSHIDFDNRLPRGIRYARNGSVKSIKIKENTITARVQGTAPRPYSVNIVVPPFFVADIKKLIKGISSRPVIVSKLLKKELDPGLLEISDKTGLKVFPKKWSDFKMQCSCPDWAVPCKHIAAVIYMVSREIDNNPFLVFEMHGVNLPEELEKEGIYIREIVQEGIPVLSKMLKGSSRGKKNEEGKSQNDPATESKSPDYSRLNPINEPLVSLLSEKPVFYTETADFREKYASLMKKITLEARRILNGKSSFEKHGAGKKLKNSGRADMPRRIITRHDDYYMLLDGEGVAAVVNCSSGEKSVLPDTFTELWQLPYAHLEDYMPTLAAIHRSLQLAVNLLANGAVTPQIVQLDSRNYAIRWLPALISREVKELVESFKSSVPRSLLRSDEKTLIGKDTHVNLISCWLNGLIPLLYGQKGEGHIADMFFAGIPQAFRGPAQKGIPGGIQSWLGKLYISQGRFTPVIVVNEDENGSDFQIEVNIRLDRKSLDAPLSLSEIISDKKYEEIRFEIFRSLSHISELIPGLDNYINSGGREPLTVGLSGLGKFIMDAVPVIKLLDIEVVMPKSLQDIMRPRASIRLKKRTESSGFMRLDRLLDFDWQVAVGDTLLDEQEFDSLVEKSGSLIKFKTGYMYVDHGELDKLRKHFSSSRNMSSLDLLRIAVSEEYNGACISLTDEVKQIISELTEQSEIPLPAGLRASLRPYQGRGYSWICRNSRAGFGSLIADDMGLGKTLQVIAVLLKFREEKLLEKEKALVVVPTGLLTNWQAELDKFAPDLRYSVYHGAQRELPGKNRDYDLLLTSYGTGRSDIEKLKKVKWHTVIIDEAQNIKNSDAAQSRAVRSIPASVYIAMSGTPVENHLTELWSIMDFCNRGFLGSVSDFRERFGNPIQFQNDTSAAGTLRKVTSPFIMRRLKSDKSIIDDLPDKIEIDSYCRLAPEQASLYEKTLEKAMEKISGIEDTDSRSLFVRQGLVLQMILALKQICNHPTQFLKNNAFDPMLSGKTEMLFDKLEPILESGEKVLLFTQFTEMAELLRRFIAEKFGENPLYYHGGCSVKQRRDMVDLFQKNRADRIFILSLKAGGTGLNLTAASHVIHYDLWWNPAVEAQATDRAYRIGQKSNVMVHRFITKGTFEERINEMLRSKKNLAEITVATGENWIGNLGNNELRDIFELEKV